METFLALLALCAGNSPVTGEFPAQRPVTQSFDIFFDLKWINGWVSNREAGDLRRQCAHYDVIEMLYGLCFVVGGCGLVMADLSDIIKFPSASKLNMKNMGSYIPWILYKLIISPQQNKTG